MIHIYNDDNHYLLFKMMDVGFKFDVIYADVMYESLDFRWANLAYELLSDNGIFYLQTDWHTAAEWKIKLDGLFNRQILNWLITIQEWGGTSKRFFPRKHDDILMYAKGDNYKFYPEKIQVPKVTANTKLDKNGTGKKTPCDVFYDLGNFSTLSKERVKIDGKNVGWQKPIKLFERILGVCTDENDLILDPFMGVGSCGVYCKQNNLEYYGIERDKKKFRVAKNRLEI